jgi:hypothetical protein
MLHRGIVGIAAFARQSPMPARHGYCENAVKEVTPAVG